MSTSKQESSQPSAGANEVVSTGLLAASPRRRGILAQLRDRYPDKQWTAVRDGMSWGYETADGWSAGWRSCLAPTWDGDDETCVSRFFIYKPDAPTEEVFFG